MANTSIIILSQDLFRISFLVQQAALQVKVYLPALFSYTTIQLLVGLTFCLIVSSLDFMMLVLDIFVEALKAV